jgi:hypothetical protein
MPKKITVIGRGTVGVMTVGLLLKRTDYDIEWIYDPLIPATSVGEGTGLLLPAILYEAFDFRGIDLIETGGTVKHGIQKENWSNKNSFFHSFPVLNTAIHFSALKLQDFLSEKIRKNSRVNIIEKFIDDPYSLDSDHVIVCVGSPKDFSEENFIIKKHIPVNSAYVINCNWEKPEFDYTLTIARKHGWVFGIPLQKRISIGYMFNKDISSIEEIKEDIKVVIDKYNITPSEKDPKIMNFNSYIRKNNFGDKVSYNGNASFFLEPLEATSTGISIEVLLSILKVISGEITKEEAQKSYEDRIDNVETMINLHYMAGSIFDTEFWKYAKLLAIEKIEREFKYKTPIARFIAHSLTDEEQFNDKENEILGIWPRYSYEFNIIALDIKDHILSFIDKYLR